MRYFSHVLTKTFLGPKKSLVLMVVFLLLQFKEKRGELQIIKSTFVSRVSEFLRNYFATFVDFMMNDKNYFSQVFSA